MKGQRTQHACHKASTRELHDAVWNRQSNEPRRECEPTYTLDREVAQARADMGDAKWARLQAEWGAA